MRGGSSKIGKRAFVALVKYFERSFSLLKICRQRSVVKYCVHDIQTRTKEWSNATVEETPLSDKAEI